MLALQSALQLGIPGGPELLIILLVLLLFLVVPVGLLVVVGAYLLYRRIQRGESENPDAGDSTTGAGIAAKSTGRASTEDAEDGEAADADADARATDGER